VRQATFEKHWCLRAILAAAHDGRREVATPAAAGGWGQYPMTRRLRRREGYEAFILGHDRLYPVRHDRRLEYNNIAFIHHHHRDRFAMNGPDTIRSAHVIGDTPNGRTRFD
jgi:hypothetical protein